MSYQAKITSKGQVTLPVGLRERLGLRDGDSVEFYFDDQGHVLMRQRNAPATLVFEQFNNEVMVATHGTDDAAIAEAAVVRDKRSQKRGQPKRRSRRRAA